MAAANDRTRAERQVKKSSREGGVKLHGVVGREEGEGATNQRVVGEVWGRWGKVIVPR